MKCYICRKDKLSKEFPRVTLTNSCDHAPLHCLRCLIECVETKESCPCGQSVQKSDRRFKQFKTAFNCLFPVYLPSNQVSDVPAASTKTGDRIAIVQLDGEGTTIPFQATMTVLELKQQIEKSLKHKASKQRLIHNEKELKVRLQDGSLARLSDYNVQPHNTIHLMVLLYAIPDHFNEVVFDLFWGYPSSGCDYLDASCLVYSGGNFCSVIDYRNRASPNNAIWHSGDVLNDFTKTGHHTINVKLKNLPSNISHLFFTLSAWNSPNISKYPSPSLNFFEASNKSKSLCNTTFVHAGLSQAVIMCSVSRVDGAWQIFESGKLSRGNAKNYEPIKATINKIIESGM
ncbi:uncharacterized protein LOC106173543 [Lingula anatina]|uniref:Uncharacterized protein LOC106173543 n=1 Tax=Lingula anatina TaxID=7574 RepID=A0A1S3JIB7_LINAN|nr:uncharacterized protein LOC106173543 [Lingula anatina]|eukprot:XP_013410155.1 uncharacterized protein LOC106173543 [Lingula anatina]